MVDLVLGLGGDLVSGFAGLGGLGDHVGTLDLAAESLDDHASDLVRVGVRGRPAVLEVALTLFGDGAVDTDGGTAVGDTPGELVI